MSIECKLPCYGAICDLIGSTPSHRLDRYKVDELLEVLEKRKRGENEDPPLVTIRNKKASRVIMQYDIYGKFIKKWETQTEAARKTGIAIAGISTCCRRKAKHAGFYIWRYENDTENGIRGNKC